MSSGARRNNQASNSFCEVANGIGAFVKPLDWGGEDRHDMGTFGHFLTRKASLVYHDPSGNRAVRERKRATLKTISEATGFALTTVSRALKNEPEIGAETRGKVQAVAAKPRLSARPGRPRSADRADPGRRADSRPDVSPSPSSKGASSPASPRSSTTRPPTT